MENTGPKLLKKVTNLMLAVFKHTANNFEKVTDAQHEARLSVCCGANGEPPCAAFDAENFVCRDFNCGCPLRKKAYWRSEDCPRGHWPKLKNRGNRK